MPMPLPEPVPGLWRNRNDMSEPKDHKVPALSNLRIQNNKALRSNRKCVTHPAFACLELL